MSPDDIKFVLQNLVICVFVNGQMVAYKTFMTKFNINFNNLFYYKDKATHKYVFIE